MNGGHHVERYKDGDSSGDENDDGDGRDDNCMYRVIMKGMVNFVLMIIRMMMMMMMIMWMTMMMMMMMMMIIIIMIIMVWFRIIKNTI